MKVALLDSGVLFVTAAVILFFISIYTSLRDNIVSNILFLTYKIDNVAGWWQQLP